jgi:ketosteroid isomerase-like protein
VNNRQAIADRVEIEALRGEYTDALMMRDWDRLTSLFAHDGAVRMPHVPAELAGRQEIRAGIERLQALLDYFVQTTHPGTIRLDGDTAAGRAYISELIRFRDGNSHLNYAVYHDRYQRTAGSSPSASTRSDTSTPHRWPARRPHAAGAPANANPPAESTSPAEERP